jgi:uncharacterized protein
MSRILAALSWLIGARTLATDAIPLPPREELTPRPLNISDAALGLLRVDELHPPQRMDHRRSPFAGLPTPPPGVRPDALPPGVATMAMDDARPQAGQFLANWAQSGLWGEGMFFMGYPYLAELAQRPEYRHIVETIAEQMTRKWVKLVSTGDEDKTEKIRALEDAMKRFNLRDVFHKCIALGETFGRGQLYIDIEGVSDDPAELAMPITRDNKGRIAATKIPKGKLQGFVPIDPTWTSPLFYNSIDPLKPNFYIPDSWYVMGKHVHGSRLLTMVPHEVPDLLKAAYNFGGVSMIQMAKPYVDNWLRTRQSVSDLIHSFSVFVLKTNWSAVVADVGVMARRISAFILGRDNKGLMIIDKDTEELENKAAPLGTLDRLQAQAQEQMASVSQEPLVWLLGISPSGLNATADGEIRVFYDRIKAKQEKTFGPFLTDAIEIIQLNEFGTIDPDITFEFLPLWELDDAGKAAVQKTKADTDAVLTGASIISNDDARTRLAADVESPYHGLEGDAPEPMEAAMVDPDKADVTGRIEKEGAEGSETEANSGV